MRSRDVPCRAVAACFPRALPFKVASLAPLELFHLTDTILPREERPFLYLYEILEDPEACKPPQPVAPRIAWSKQLTLLAAREKSGKSTLAGAAAAAVSRGSPFLGEVAQAGNVLIIALEESRNAFAQRLVRFGADATRIAVIERFSGNGDLVAAIQEAARIHKPDLIIWDTLGAFANEVSGKTLDPGDAQGWTRIMMVILDVAREHGACLILHHAKKSDGTYRDSTAIGASVDVILEMHGEGMEPRTIKAKARFDVPDIRLKLEGNVFQLIESEAELEARVFSFVARHTGTSFRDMREELGIRNDTLGRIRDKLIRQGKIVNVADGVAHRYKAVLPFPTIEKDLGNDAN